MSLRLAIVMFLASLLGPCNPSIARDEQPRDRAETELIFHGSGLVR